MTVTAVQLESVRASVDAALETLNDSLRKLNHEVSRKTLSLLSFKVKTTYKSFRFRSGRTLNLPTKSTVPTTTSVTSSKTKVSPSLAMHMDWTLLLKPSVDRGDD